MEYIENPETEKAKLQVIIEEYLQSYTKSKTFQLLIARIATNQKLPQELKKFLLKSLNNETTRFENCFQSPNVLVIDMLLHFKAKLINILKTYAFNQLLEREIEKQLGRQYFCKKIMELDLHVKFFMERTDNSFRINEIKNFAKFVVQKYNKLVEKLSDILLVTHSLQISTEIWLALILELGFSYTINSPDSNSIDFDEDLSSTNFASSSLYSLLSNIHQIVDELVDRFQKFFSEEHNLYLLKNTLFQIKKFSLENYHFSHLQSEQSKWNVSTILETKKARQFLSTPEYKLFREEELAKIYNEIINELSISKRKENSNLKTDWGIYHKKYHLSNCYQNYFKCNKKTADCFLNTVSAKNYLEGTDTQNPLEKIVRLSLLEIADGIAYSVPEIALIFRILRNSSKKVPYQDCYSFIFQLSQVFSYSDSNIFLVSPPNLDFFTKFDTQWFRQQFPNCFSDHFRK
ncbi:hypothetical protein M0811_00050 [Anaeramoeba ignava]|uniref:Uncharacterized protein n=1 Tax=Anaeramoeba ignava TaxID=1746090 RepID=A0A9Q0LSM5_ANAIG|nr:hypothetical protein M0811_00050 [Anaeramoeba ignava]